MYVRMVANIAMGDKPDGSEKVPAASAEEIKIFEQSRRHLPATVFDANRWQAVVGPEWWPHVVTVLNRGGRFQDYKKAYKDGQMANKYGKMLGIYFDKLVSTKNSMTGKPYLGHADYIEGPQDCTGKLINDEAQGYDFTLITYKTISQTKSRTIGNYWLDALLPENFIEISAADAQRLGLHTGDQVKVVSASNEDGLWDLGQGQKKPMIGKVRVSSRASGPEWRLFLWDLGIGPTAPGRWSLTACPFPAIPAGPPASMPMPPCVSIQS